MKNFGAHKSEERVQKAKAAAELLAKHELDQVAKVKVLQQRVFELKSGNIEARDVLLVEGKASTEQGD